METLIEVIKAVAIFGGMTTVILYLSKLLGESKRFEYEEAVFREARDLREGKITYIELLQDVGKEEADDAADLAYGPQWAEEERFGEGRGFPTNTL